MKFAWLRDVNRHPIETGGTCEWNCPFTFLAIASADVRPAREGRACLLHRSGSWRASGVQLVERCGTVGVCKGGDRDGGRPSAKPNTMLTAWKFAACEHSPESVLLRITTIGRTTRLAYIVIRFSFQTIVFV